MIGTLLRNRRVAFGFVVLAALLLVAVFAPWLAPHDPTEQDLLNTFAPPAWSGGQRAFLFGTDSLGRDILSRLIYGARVALVVAVVAATLAGLLGTALGLAAGYLGGRVDNAISRLVDVWMSFPAVLLSIVLAAVLGAGLHTVIIAIVVIDWTRFCRVMRSEVLVQREQDYVASAITIGLTPSPKSMSSRRPVFRSIRLRPSSLPIHRIPSRSSRMAFTKSSVRLFGSPGTCLNTSKRCEPLAK